MDNLEEKLENLEKLVADNAESSKEENSDIKNDNDTEKNEQALTINDMSYLQVTEMAKKSNLIATSKDKTFIEYKLSRNKCKC